MGKIEVTFRDGEKEKVITADAGATLFSLAREAWPDTVAAGKAAAAKKGKRLLELRYKVYQNSEFELVRSETTIGHDMYKRSLILLMLRAARDVVPAGGDPQAGGCAACPMRRSSMEP